MHGKNSILIMTSRQIPKDDDPALSRTSQVFNFEAVGGVGSRINDEVGHEALRLIVLQGQEGGVMCLWSYGFRGVMGGGGVGVFYGGTVYGGSNIVDPSLFIFYRRRLSFFVGPRVLGGLGSPGNFGLGFRNVEFESVVIFKTCCTVRI